MTDPLASPPRTPPFSPRSPVLNQLAFPKHEPIIAFDDFALSPSLLEISPATTSATNTTDDDLNLLSSPEKSANDKELEPELHNADQSLENKEFASLSAALDTATFDFPASFGTTSSSDVKPLPPAPASTPVLTVQTSSTRATKPRTYQDATPSKHCHICSARPSAASPHLVCANLRRGTCRKTVCAKCFAKHGWDLAAARAAARVWRCPHCRGACPRAAQCFIYGRTTARRRQTAMRARAAAKRAAAPDRVTAAARRAAYLAEQIVRQAHAEAAVWDAPFDPADMKDNAFVTGGADLELCAFGDQNNAGSNTLLFDTSEEWLGTGY